MSYDSVSHQPVFVLDANRGYENHPPNIVAVAVWRCLFYANILLYAPQMDQSTDEIKA